MTLIVIFSLSLLFFGGLTVVAFEANWALTETIAQVLAAVSFVGLYFSIGFYLNAQYYG